jgi:hypothetical protein
MPMKLTVLAVGDTGQKGMFRNIQFISIGNFEAFKGVVEDYVEPTSS